MAQVDINFNEGVDAEAFTEVVQDAPRRSSWTIKLTELAAALAAGQGTFGKFYKIGEFGAAQGAKTVIKTITKRVQAGEQLPAVFDLRPQAINLPSGKRGSQLWAAVIEIPPTSTVQPAGVQLQPQATAPLGSMTDDEFALDTAPAET